MSLHGVLINNLLAATHIQQMLSVWLLNMNKTTALLNNDMLY